MSIDVTVQSISAYILIFCRVGGMIFFNPLLARRNMPTQFKIALVLGTTLLMTPMLYDQLPTVMNDFSFIYMMFMELAVGFACGFVFQIFYYLLFTAGDIIDMGFGLAMAKAFDPATNVQASFSASFFEFIFVLYIFATNCHLILIKLIHSSYSVVSMGAVDFGANVGQFITTLFSSAFMLIIQLALPYIAATFVLEISMGLLMKLVPQINVFVLHFQFKILVGLLLLFLFAGPTTNFMMNYIDNLFKSLNNIFYVF